MDFERHQNLHTIIVLKEVIRKWWRSELCFADKNGAVVNRQRDSAEGFRRYSRSCRALHEKFRSSKELRSAVFRDSHLNLMVVGAPLYLNGEYEGFIFVTGFLREPLDGPAAQELKATIRDGNPEAAALDGPLERIPMIDSAELGKLTDLLELGVSEIASYESEMIKRDTAIPSLASRLSGRYKFENIVSKSEPMLQVFRLLEKVCNCESTVLIQGESGTGKELVARAIHDNGPRRDKPFVVQNCSAFNDNLLESALFGHTRGAFTGALRDKKGLFEVADEGTFFLDEVGDMSPALQVKLLRVLQEGTFLSVGGTQTKEVDVRLIAATHKDLSELVKLGSFREDLFYRINVIHVRVPPLRDRRDDVPILIDHFLRKHQREGERVRGLSLDAVDILTGYSWPGNIRELENEIERLLVLGSDQETIPSHLISSRIRQSAPQASRLRSTGKLNEMVERLERDMIQQGLLRTNNNKSRLARELGISRSNLILKIARYGLESTDGEESDETARA